LLATKQATTETNEQKQNTQAQDNFLSTNTQPSYWLLPLLLLHAAQTPNPQILADACKDTHMAVDPCSAKDAAAQTRHVGRANRLEQEILCSLLQAPDREHHACEEAKKNKMQKKT
jgi:folylpolyglutamate synthase/dihydropteroate synthase